MKRHYVYIGARDLNELERLVNEKTEQGYVCDGSHTSFLHFQGEAFVYAEHTQRMWKEVKERVLVEEKPGQTMYAKEFIERFTDRLARRLNEVRLNVKPEYIKSELVEIIAALKKGPTMEDLQERI